VRNRSEIEEEIEAAQKEMTALELKRIGFRAKLASLKFLANLSNIYRSPPPKMLPKKKKSPCFGPCSEAGRMFFPSALKARKRVKADTSPFAGMSGSDQSVRNRKLNVASVKIGISYR